MEAIDLLISTLPKSPGVYQFFNREGKIIYIGKAKNLHSRVSSYFKKGVYESYKTKVLANHVFDIKHIVVESESDALLLENNLIKKFQPKYNVLLKDDKTFPWICIKNENFPRIYSTRTFIRDGSVYYGPYTSAIMVRTLLNLIRQLYQLRTCSLILMPQNIQREKFKKCLEFHIGNCKAPCEQLQDETDYNKSILQIKEILKGNIQEVILHLKQLMQQFSSAYQFEEAEKVKQKIAMLERYKSKSTIVNSKINNIDVFSYVEKNKSAFVNFLKVMNGAIVQSLSVELIKRLEEDKSELLGIAIDDIRSRVQSNSREIIVPFLPYNEYESVHFIIPKTGDKKKLLELSERNALQGLLQKDKQIEEKSFESRTISLLERAKSELRLNVLPIHIECFDNSNIQGTNPVAACVVFKNGKPSKRDYRHFNIKTVEGANDFASMEEIVYRRYSRLVEEGSPLPQLIIIDGGKGQLHAAISSLEKLNLESKIAILGIAKRLEELYFPNDPVPLYLDKNSTTLKLIQNLRNEAHRFGITFHRQKRSSSMIKSELEGISGVGEKTIVKLIQHFGSVNEIKSRSLEELEVVAGKKSAQLIVEHFSNKP